MAIDQGKGEISPVLLKLLLPAEEGVIVVQGEISPEDKGDDAY